MLGGWGWRGFKWDFSFKKGSAETQRWNWVKEMGEGECIHQQNTHLHTQDVCRKPPVMEKSLQKWLLFIYLKMYFGILVVLFFGGGGAEKKNIK